MTSGASLPSGEHRRSASRRVSSASSSTPPSRANAATSASSTGATAMTLFSDEHDVALSNVFERAIFAAASRDVGGLVDDRRRRCRRRRRPPACRSRRPRARWSASRSRRRDRPARISANVASRVDRRRQQLHEIARRADAVELRVHELEQQRERRRALGRRREDDRVAALERVDDVVGRRRAGIGRRRDRGDDADGPRDLDQPAPAILRDDADRLRAAQVAQQAERLAPVLGDLVVDVAEPGVAHRAARPARGCAPARRSPSRRRRRPRRRAPASTFRTHAAPRGRAPRARRRSRPPIGLRFRRQGQRTFIPA